MKILLVSRDFNQYQGIGRYTLELVKQFIKKHEVHLLTTNYDYKPISNLVVHKAPIIIKKPFWIERLINYYFDTKYAKQIKRKFNIDIVASCECFFCDVIIANSCNRAAVKEANKISKKEFFYPKYLLYKIRRWLLFKNRVILMLEKRVFERGNKKIITVSNATKREILENYNVPEDKITVVYNGVNLDEFKPCSEKRLEIRRKYNIGEDDIILMFSGYEFKRKGLKYIIKALPLIKSNVKLVVVSEDNPKPYKKLAIRLGVLDKIIFTGFVPEIKDYYAASDIFIFPTLYEPFGMVVIEAMASGLPVIVSKLAGVAEIMKHGYDGLLLDDPTNLNEIAEKINLLTSNENLRKQIGENARKTAQKHSWEEKARRTIEVYQEVLEMKKF
jgi:UDP-glucose:(heptosyl)LPS alpha-1,3-glucosyltransferase